jgi:hypothetical protein
MHTNRTEPFVDPALMSLPLPVLWLAVGVSLEGELHQVDSNYVLYLPSSFKDI